MKAITVTFIARDNQDAASINSDLEDSHVLNNWPVFAWGQRDVTDAEAAWLRDEYDAALEEGDE